MIPAWQRDVIVFLKCLRDRIKSAEGSREGARLWDHDLEDIEKILKQAGEEL